MLLVGKTPGAKPRQGQLTGRVLCSRNCSVCSLRWRSSHVPTCVVSSYSELSPWLSRLPALGLLPGLWQTVRLGDAQEEKASLEGQQLCWNLFMTLYLCMDSASKLSSYWNIKYLEAWKSRMSAVVFPFVLWPPHTRCYLLIPSSPSRQASEMICLESNPVAHLRGIPVLHHSEPDCPFTLF